MVVFNYCNFVTLNDYFVVEWNINTIYCGLVLKVVEGRLNWYPSLSSVDLNDYENL
jgi:heme/copper-type cytochrome/quinol oxidase subunit 1